MTGHGFGLDYREIVGPGTTYVHFLRSVQTSLMFSGYWELGGGALSLGIKLPGCETDHSPPSGAEAKDKRSYTSTLGETGEEPVVEYTIRTVTVRIRVKCEGQTNILMK